MAQTFRIQFDANNEIVEADEAHVQIERPEGVTGGAQVRDVNEFNASLQQAAQQIRDPQRDARQKAELEQRINAYNDEANRIAHVEAAGGAVTAAEKRRLQGERNSLAIMAAGLGVDIGT